MPLGSVGRAEVWGERWAEVAAISRLRERNSSERLQQKSSWSILSKTILVSPGHFANSNSRHLGSKALRRFVGRSLSSHRTNGKPTDAGVLRNVPAFSSGHKSQTVRQSPFPKRPVSAKAADGGRAPDFLHGIQTVPKKSPTPKQLQGYEQDFHSPSQA